MIQKRSLFVLRAFNCVFTQLHADSNIALAQTAFEEAYITILDIDGPVWAEKLLSAMQVSLVEDDMIPPPTEHTSLLTGSKV